MNVFIHKLKNNLDLTFDFVGDSITFGLNHCRPEETYVAKFASLIAQKLDKYSVYRYDGIYSDELSHMESFDGPILISYKDGAPKLDIFRNGIGGNNIPRALNRIDDFTGFLSNGSSPDVTFLMFGVNDALKSNPSRYTTAEQFKCNYKLLINEIKKRNPDTFIVMISATYNDQSVDEHCEKSKELAFEENIPYIDLHKIWVNHFNSNASNFGQGDWLAGGCDACHPTPKAAYIMAEKIYDDFIRIISES